MSANKNLIRHQNIQVVLKELFQKGPLCIRSGKRDRHQHGDDQFFIKRSCFRGNGNERQARSKRDWAPSYRILL